MDLRIVSGTMMFTVNSYRCHLTYRKHKKIPKACNICNLITHSVALCMDKITCMYNFETYICDKCLDILSAIYTIKTSNLPFDMILVKRNIDLQFVLAPTLSNINFSHRFDASDLATNYKKVIVIMYLINTYLIHDLMNKIFVKYILDSTPA